jgi:hypothetical protein
VVLLLLASLALVASTSFAQPLPVFTNIEQLLNGYDVTVASPLTTPDLGFRGTIFTPTYVQNKTYDGLYSIPDGIDVTAQVSCELKGSINSLNILSSGAAFQAAMASGGISSLPGTPLAQTIFSGGSIYASMFAGSVSESDIIIANSVLCSMYYASLETNSLPTFTDEFVRAVEKINFLDAASLKAFSAEFGTHYVTRGTMGGSSFTYNKLSQSSFTNMSANGFAFGNMAQLAFFDTIGINIAGSNGYADYLYFMSNSVDQKTFTFYTPIPPPDTSDPDNSELWQKAVAVGANPGPQIVAFSLAPITDLFLPALFPGDQNISHKLSALSSFLDSTYCSTVPSCSYVNPTPMVSYFYANECPSGWQPYAPAGGRFIVTADGSQSFPIGVSNGQPLLDTQDPLHTHYGSTVFPVSGTAVGAAQGCSDNTMNPGNFDIDATFNPSPSGLPLAQVLTCALPASAPQPINVSFPSGGYHYFASNTLQCPLGWALASSMPYGFTLMPNADSNLAPSQAPLAIGAPLTHYHEYLATASTPSSVGVIGISTGNAPAGTASATLNGTASLSGNLPYLSLLMCRQIATPNVTDTPQGLLIIAEDCLDINDTHKTWVPLDYFDGNFVVSSPVGGNTHAIYGSGAKQPGNSANLYQNFHNHTITETATGSGCTDYCLDTCCSGQGSPICFPGCEWPISHKLACLLNLFLIRCLITIPPFSPSSR